MRIETELDPGISIEMEGLDSDGDMEMLVEEDGESIRVYLTADERIQMMDWLARYTDTDA